MSHFVYVIASSETGPCKVGITHAPEKRLKQLQTGHPAKLRIWHLLECEDARRMERIIHDTLKIHRASGEWFHLSVEDAIAEVRFAEIRYTPASE